MNSSQVFDIRAIKMVHYTVVSSNDDDGWGVNETALEWHEMAGKTFKYSAVCSSGFFVALFIALIIYLVMQRKKGEESESDPLYWNDLGKQEEKGEAEADVGRFGKFMICVELLDAIPEAAIIADATVQGSISWSFVIAITALNVCNGLATAMDFLAKNRETGKSNCQDSIRVCLFLCIFYAVGILAYSISADIYADFVDKYDGNDRNVDHLLLLMGGTVFGGLLIAMLVKVEAWLHHKSVASGEEGPLPTFATRVWQCFFLFFVIFFWTCTVSFGLASIFWVFVSHSKSAYIESALEGLSGGAFLATVAGTMIPRLQQDALNIQWSEVRKKLVGVLMFEFGILSGVAIDVLT